jgi:hypothetical protein
MPGRPIPSETELRNSANRFANPESAQRRVVLKDTLRAFLDAEPPDRYHQLAKTNLQRWCRESQGGAAKLSVQVVPGDWGEVALSLTQQYGTCFAVLNMANAYVPGGAYVEGAVAQEENMFRRTNCHFCIGEDEYDVGLDRYIPEMTQLLSAVKGTVYLDTERPRVCIRGPEDRSRHDLGYPWLADDQVFPFYELRAAAQDLRDGSSFNAEEARRRIAAQLDTLRARGVRHAVLSAFGCGAFQNPAPQVARIYKDEIDQRREDFSVIAFAIFAPGYGPDNYAPFAKIFQHPE